jgi:hypothetical protein
MSAPFMRRSIRKRSVNGESRTPAASTPPVFTWPRRLPREHNEALDRHIEGLRGRTPSDVEDYLQHLLSAVPLPDGFPRTADVTFNPRTEHAIVQWELPQRDTIPTVASYRYSR